MTKQDFERLKSYCMKNLILRYGIIQGEQQYKALSMEEAVRIWDRRNIN